MLNNIITWSLRHKSLVLLIASMTAIFGIWSLLSMKVDILPDINKPIVTIFAESPGMAAEEIERLVLNPLETSIVGISGVDRIRGNASFAQATLTIEFAWGSDPLRNRQLVQERLSRAILPRGVVPTLGPSTSLLGEIMWIGITSNSAVTNMELRTLADWTIRPALLKTPGVAGVLVMGGDVREWQINLNADRMRWYGFMIDDVRSKVETALTNKSGNILVEGNKEYPIRIIVAPNEVQELGEIAVGRGNDGRVVRLIDIASVEEGPSPIRGNASIDGTSGIIMRIIRQPDAQTLPVTDALNETMNSLKASVPEGVELHANLFRQESFIRAGLENVGEALRDGTLFVVIVLVIFLMNIRATVITLVALPLSILATAIIFKQFGLSVNVLTLGGVAVAVGELVDDAIVGVENVFRRLRAWSIEGKKERREHIVLLASSEVRNSIVYATVLVSVVFLPLFFMPGIEGRLLTSLGAAYLVALLASMVVSLTVTPVLSALLLSDESLIGHEQETKMVTALKKKITPWMYWCINNANVVAYVTIGALACTVGLYFLAGKEGIPKFNEGSAVVMLFLPAGTALSATHTYVERLETALLKIEGVRQVSSIAGRAQSDPHGGSANASEVQIAFKTGFFENDRKVILEKIQSTLDSIGGADYSLGQPITHRVEMLLSGVRAPIVVKVFGDTPDNMEKAAQQVLRALKEQEGVTNPRINQNTVVPEFHLYIDRNRLAEQGLSSGEAANEIAMGLMGDTFGQVRIGSASVNVVARYDAESRGAMSSLRDLALPFSTTASIGSAADARVEGGRNSIEHEGGKRVLIVSANYQGNDIVGAVLDAKDALENSKLPVGTTLSFEGDYKSQRESTRQLALVFLVGSVFIVATLYHAFASIPIILLILANIPTVMIGGMAGIWLTGGTINMAHLVGFISLAGIVSRNGIMLIGRSLALVRNEGAVFSPDTIVRATLDRVVPVLMTSLVTALALVPLLLSGGESGKEILHPLAVVVFGGLISSTAISLFLTPALFYRFGKRAALQTNKESASGF